MVSSRALAALLVTIVASGCGSDAVELDPGAQPEVLGDLPPVHPTCPAVAGWDVGLRGAGEERVVDLALDASCGLLVSAEIAGSATLAGASLAPSLPGTHAVIARLEPSGGALSWAHVLPTSGVVDDDTPPRALLRPYDAGDTVVAGALHRPITLGDRVLEPSAPQSAFVGRLDGAGEPRWLHELGGHGAIVRAITVDRDGRIVLGGDFEGSLDFGGGAMSSVGGRDGFVVALDAAGHHVWSMRVGDAHDDRVESLALDSFGRVIVGGSQGLSDGGCGAFGCDDALTSAAFVAALDSDGLPAWSVRFGEDVGARRVRVAADRGGRTLALWDEVGRLALAQLDASGQERWLRDLTGAPGAALSATPEGDALVFGARGGWWGDDAPSVYGALFLVRVSPDGAPKAHRTFDAGWGSEASALVADAGGRVVTAGSFDQTYEGGSAPMSSLGVDGFASRFALGSLDVVPNDEPF